MRKISGIFEVENINGKVFINYEHFLEYDKRKNKEIERLNNTLDELEQVIKNYKYTNTCHCYSCNKELCDILLDKIKELKGKDNE